MLQVRITEVDGSEPIILDQAESISIFKTVNSSDEGVSFEIAKNSSKADIINPDTNDGYAKLWEVWDTITNERINYGPITNITENGPNWKVTGAGRSQFLEDIMDSTKTFYAKIDQFVDGLRFENLAIEPRTTTLVHSGDDENVSEDIVFAGITFGDEHHGLSKQTKDRAIDDDTGYVKLNSTEPSRSFYTTSSFWGGMSPSDTLIVDLGQEYDITKIKLLLPWWGGKERKQNRSYEFSIAYASEGTYIGSPDPVQGRQFSQFHNLYDTAGVGTNRLVTHPEYPYDFWIGTTNSGIGYGPNNIYVGVPNKTDSANMRFIRVHVSDVHAWYGSAYDDDPGHDGYDYQCDPEYTAGSDSFFGSKKGIMHNKTIPDRSLKPENDCYAAIVELGAYKEILPRGDIQALALQKIDSNNLQISYSRNVDASETRRYKSGLHRKFEPGMFFRHFTFDYSGASNTYYKFWSTDCANCYPDGYSFGIQDQNNNMIYSSDATAATDEDGRASIYTKHIIMRGTSDAHVTWCDAWKGQTDQLSYGGSYAYCDNVGDYATVHFKGSSFKWFATIPSDKTGATVKIEIRHKDPHFQHHGGSGGQGWGAVAWSAWTTLEASYTLTNDIHGENVYEITYESGTLTDQVYEIKITNLDGNYCSIDSFEGYWSGSFTMYGEDSTRIKLSDESAFKQIYDSRFQGGSMYKFNKSGASANLTFEGDRIIILSAKGRNHGNLRLNLSRFTTTYGTYDPGLDDRVIIPGGNSDGTLTVSLESHKRGNESTQYIAFDSNEWFPDGLTWGLYNMSIVNGPIETYSATKNEIQSENFVYRCHHCNPDTSGNHTINKHVYLDAIGVHEAVGLSLTFDNQTHLSQLKSVAEALQVEWDIDDDGVSLKPRVGTDTDVALKEGSNTLVDFEIVNDVTKVASILLSSGSDIDGLPLFTITEDKKAREILGRTVMREEDFRDIGDYQQLIGISRGELRKRRVPEKRISITHTGEFTLDEGDSFLLYTKKMGQIRARIMRKQRDQSSNGTVYTLECTIWPLTT